MVAGGEGIADKIPSADRVPSNEDLEKRLTDLVHAQLGDIEVNPIMKEIDPQFNLSSFVNGTDGVFKTMKYSSTPPKDPERGLYAKNWNGLAYTKMKTWNTVYNYLYEKVFLPKYGQTSAWQSIKTSTARKRVVSFLEGLAKAIKLSHDSMVNSFGTSEVAKARSAALTQWDLNYAQATNEDYPVNAEYLGELQIGGAYVEQMLTQVSEILNQEIFAVFSSLKELSDSLNGFFAGGLADDRKAATAIESAQDIEKKTTELKSD
jgi:hypothetical protein